MDSLRVVTLTEQELSKLLERVVTTTVEQTLARVLSPFTQTSLPDGVSARAFLAACRNGCPHQKRGRTVLVERSAWAAWVQSRPMTAPRKVTARAHPTPANDLDLDALLDDATRR